MELPILMVTFLVLWLTGVLIGFLLHWIKRLKTKVKKCTCQIQSSVTPFVWTGAFQSFGNAISNTLNIIPSSSYSLLIDSFHMLPIFTKETTPCFLPDLQLEPFLENFEDHPRDPALLCDECGNVLVNNSLFCGFGDQVLLNLCKRIKFIELEAEEYLFKCSDDDDGLFILTSGSVNVFKSFPDGTIYLLKTAFPKDIICSVITMLDYLCNSNAIYHTLSARATTKSRLIKLPFKAVKQVMEMDSKSSDMFINLLVTRISRIYYTGIPELFGLTKELFIEQCINEADSVEAILGSYMESIDDPYQKFVAHRAFRTCLDLENDLLLQDQIELKLLYPGQRIVEENSKVPSEHGLIYVMEGLLETTRHVCNGKEKIMFFVKSDEFVEGVPLFSKQSGFMNVKAKYWSFVAILPRLALEEIINKSIRSSTNLLKIFNRRLSSFSREIDYGVDWITVPTNQCVYNQDDADCCAYIILFGQLRSVVTHFNGIKSHLSDSGKGQCVGIEEAISKTKRYCTVFATKSTEVVRIAEKLMDYIKFKYPKVLENVIVKMGERMHSSALNLMKQGISSRNRPKYSVVCLVPISTNVSLSVFSFVLKNTLKIYGPAIVLTSNTAKNILGHSVFEQPLEHQLNMWISNNEESYAFILCQCDQTWTRWNKLCIEKADLVLSVGIGNRETPVQGLERKIGETTKFVRHDLVLLYEEGSMPENTGKWLKDRPWCNGHHHIRCPVTLFSLEYEDSYMDEDVILNQIVDNMKDIHSDFSRMARLINGSSVGVVLGGGGAKGAAHLGALKALLLNGIPIDKIGGVSIGAFVAGLYAREKDVEKVDAITRGFFEKMSDTWGFVWDITFQLTSLLSGNHFNNILKHIFQTQQMEDLLLPCFTLSTDISNSSLRVHKQGELWLYVRASMSVAGVLPPICDKKDGHLLLDGMYCDLLGVETMKTTGADLIFCIDVSAVDQKTYTDFGESLTFSWLTWKKIGQLFGANPVNIPRLFGIQDTLSLLSSKQRLDCVKIDNSSFYIRPPIDMFDTRDFSKYEDIKSCGYEEAHRYLREMSEAENQEL